MLQVSCDRKTAYVAIIVNIVPLWVILTTLVVFVLLHLHRNLRSTKVYDNCSKGTAKYAYYMEIRSGDTSSSYNRRRTTITIDMFDDNQQTLAKIAIPGHVIFGRKDSPTPVTEDDKFFDLRVTRFWLYRASRLKKVSTIRITHSCIEAEAKIMIYGVEIRTNDDDAHKLFFPVMSYISAYGSTSKPNACFDLETAGSISAMGGVHSDSSSIFAQLSWIDYSLLAYLLAAFIVYLSSFEVVQSSFDEITSSIYKGTAIGVSTFIVVFLVASLLKHVIRHNYTIQIGTGLWAYAYYSSIFLLFIFASSIWIYSIVYTYRYLCPSRYDMWVLSMGVAAIIAVVLALVGVLIEWIVQLINPRNSEQYLLPDEIGADGNSKTRSKLNQLAANKNFVAQQQQNNQYANMMTGMQQTPMQQASWQGPQIALVMPNQAQTYHTNPNAYGQPILLNQTSPTAALMKHDQSPYQRSNLYDPPLNVATLNRNLAPPPAASPPALQAQQSPGQTTTLTTTTTYNNQVGNFGKGPKPAKKVGSNESTGSSYFQQLMRNKGGVKSISQYGELLKQKKIAKNR